MWWDACMLANLSLLCTCKYSVIRSPLDKLRYLWNSGGFCNTSEPKPKPQQPLQELKEGHSVSWNSIVSNICRYKIKITVTLFETGYDEFPALLVLQADKDSQTKLREQLLWNMALLTLCSIKHFETVIGFQATPVTFWHMIYVYTYIKNYICTISKERSLMCNIISFHLFWLGFETKWFSSIKFWGKYSILFSFVWKNN